MGRTTSGAAAGAAAGIVWLTAEPVLRRAFGHPYSDAGLVTAFVTRGRLQPLIDVATQAAGGSLFGAVFARLRGGGVRRAVAAAAAENVLAWPLVGLIERRHPDVLDGSWPPVFRNPRAAAVSLSGHCVFGCVLGLLLPQVSRLRRR